MPKAKGPEGLIRIHLNKGRTGAAHGFACPGEGGHGLDQREKGHWEWEKKYKEIVPARLQGQFLKQNTSQPKEAWYWRLAATISQHHHNREGPKKQERKRMRSPHSRPMHDRARHGWVFARYNQRDGRRRQWNGHAFGKIARSARFPWWRSPRK